MEKQKIKKPRKLERPEIPEFCFINKVMEDALTHGKLEQMDKSKDEFTDMTSLEYHQEEYLVGCL